MRLNLRPERRAALVTGLGLSLAVGLQFVWLAGFTGRFVLDWDRGPHVNPLLLLTTPFVAWFVARPGIPGRRAGALGFLLPIVVAIPWGLGMGALQASRTPRLELMRRELIEALWTTWFSGHVLFPISGLTCWLAWRAAGRSADRARPPRSA